MSKCYYIIRDNVTGETLRKYHKTNPKYWAWGANYHNYVDCGDDLFCPEDVQVFRTRAEAHKVRKHLESNFQGNGEDIDFEVIKVTRKTIVLYETV